MTEKPIGRFAVLALGLVCLGLSLLSLATVSASAQSAREGRSAASGATAFAQAEPRRVRPRIRVTPRCRVQTETLTYPPPWDCNAPGPGFVRNCTAQLVQERRPSGTVIVPVTRCWWERG